MKYGKILCHFTSWYKTFSYSFKKWKICLDMWYILLFFLCIQEEMNGFMRNTTRVLWKLYSHTDKQKNTPTSVAFLENSRFSTSSHSWRIHRVIKRFGCKNCEWQRKQTVRWSMQTNRLEETPPRGQNKIISKFEKSSRIKMRASTLYRLLKMLIDWFNYK